MSGLTPIGSSAGFPSGGGAADADPISIRVRDSGLARVLPEMLADGTISKADAEALIEATQDGPGLAKTERQDLTRVLDQAGGRVDADARALLESFLGLAPSGTDSAASTDAAPTAASIWSSLATPPELNLDATGTRRAVALGSNHRFTANPDRDAQSALEVGSGMFAAASLIDDTKDNLFDSMGLDPAGQRAVLANLEKDLGSVPAGGPSPAGLSDTQALQLRSSASTVLLELMTAKNADPAVQREAFTIYRGMIGPETNPLLKDGMVFNLDRLRDALPADLHGQIDDTMEVIAPHQPPYDEWFKDGNDTVKVEWVNGDSECHDISMKQFEADGFEIVSQKPGEVKFSKDVTDNGVTTKFEVTMRNNRGDMYREVQDEGDSHMVVYTGHSNWGRNMRTALSGAETGEKGGAGKLVVTDLCVGKGEIQMFRDKFPDAHLVTTHNSSYYNSSNSEGNQAFKTMVGDIAGRRGYEAMAKNVRRDNPWASSHRREGIDNNYIFPTDLKTRRMVLDSDYDGQADVFDRVINFDAFNVSEDTAREFEPIDAARPADELVGTKVHFASQTINRLALYSGILEDSNSTGNVVPGGYFEPSPGDTSMFKFESTELNGEDVVSLRMSSSFAHMSEEAVRMAACYEYSHFMAGKDPSWRLDQEGTVLSGLVLASHSLDTDAGYRDRAVWSEFLSAYNLPDVSRSLVERAKGIDHHSYSGSYESIDHLRKELDPAVLAKLTEPGAGELGTR